MFKVSVFSNGLRGFRGTASYTERPGDPAAGKPKAVYRIRARVAGAVWRGKRYNHAFSGKTAFMQLVRGLHNVHPAPAGCVATIGNFDGVHRGHQQILLRLRERGQALGLPSCVIIFEPQPMEFFRPDDAPVRLTRLRDKLELFAAAGVDQVLCVAFNRRLQQLTAGEFVSRVLVQALNVRHLQVGDDFRFGCDRSGDFAFLQRAGAESGFSVEPTRTVTLAGQRVSSTLIRETLAAGDFTVAEQLLGRPYSILGRVLHGQKLGRQLNAPTANIQLKRRHAPLRGVYCVSVRLADGRVVPGVANIGMRPTVEQQNEIAHLEVHLLDFNEDIYGQRLAVEFHHKLRDEEKFADVVQLRAAIAEDVRRARAYWA